MSQRLVTRASVFGIAFVVGPLAALGAAKAAVTISAHATQNMTCSGNVCSPTAADAYLSVADLQTMLAAASVKVTSGNLAQDIAIANGITWVTASILTLDSYHSLTVDAPVSVAGDGGLTVLTNDGGANGAFSFGSAGNVSFWSLSSPLSINNDAYTLVGDIATLASDIAANPGGSFALASNYDASVHGTYAASPVQTVFTGTFQGLGNAISNLTITDTNSCPHVGLFADTDNPSSIANFNLVNANISGGIGARVGGIAGVARYANLSGDSVSGRIGTSYSCAYIESIAGGLVGEIDNGIITSSHTAAGVRGRSSALIGGLVGLTGRNAAISNSYETGIVFTSGGAAVGGLVGQNSGSITASRAGGKVTGGLSSRQVTILGGLVGNNSGAITDSYATGTVEEIDCCSNSVWGVGGLVGIEDYYGGNEPAPISNSYSTGLVTNDSDSVGVTGGLIGSDWTRPGSLTDTYWDLTTSGVTNPGQGAGNVNDDPGVTGLTTTQLQSGLPPGFIPTVWGQKAKINNGLPYLLGVPPG